MAAALAKRSTFIFSNILTKSYNFTCLNVSTRRSAKIHENWFSKRTWSSAVKSAKDASSFETIYSAVCVERLPIITPEKTELTKRFEELQDQLEFEKSTFSEDEVTIRNIAKKKKKLTERDEDELLEVSQFEEKRREFQQEQEEAFHKFQPASRSTVADQNNDLKSTHRRLQDTLILLLKNKDSGWEMPLTDIQDDETLRQAAERMLQEACGGGVQVKFISNAPAGVLKTTLKDSRNSHKVFFYKACYTGGSIHLGEHYKDYVWVTRDELKDYLNPDHCKTALRFVR